MSSRWTMWGKNTDAHLAAWPRGSWAGCKWLWMYWRPPSSPWGPSRWCLCVHVSATLSSLPWGLQLLSRWANTPNKHIVDSLFNVKIIEWETWWELINSAKYTFLPTRQREVYFCYCRGCVHFARHLEQRVQMGSDPFWIAKTKWRFVFKCVRHNWNAAIEVLMWWHLLTATPLLQVSCGNMEKVTCWRLYVCMYVWMFVCLLVHLLIYWNKNIFLFQIKSFWESTNPTV